jgi:DNA-binding LytR/AlgR family response regulator
MKIFLIEDEPAAMERMESLMHQINPNITICGRADSVESALDWLTNNPNPDAIFTDVQLGDGTCFEIFETFKPKSKVVFVTAYDEHALAAFKVNASDYLLKPLKKEELQIALQKVSKTSAISADDIDYDKLAQSILAEQNKYEKRYLIRYGEQIRTVTSDDLAYIYTTHKAVFLVTFAGKEYPFDKSLETLEKELDPKKFFRINRQFIINIKSVGHMHTVSKSRVQLDLTPPFKGDEVIVSTEKSPLFKEWLGGE